MVPIVCVCVSVCAANNVNKSSDVCVCAGGNVNKSSEACVCVRETSVNKSSEVCGSVGVRVALCGCRLALFGLVWFCSDLFPFGCV